MARFLVVIDPGFDREIKRLQRAGSQHVVDELLAALRRIVEDPVTPRPGFDTRRVGFPWGHGYRLSVGDYRILYEVDREAGTAFVSSVYRVGTRSRWR